MVARIVKNYTIGLRPSKIGNSVFFSLQRNPFLSSFVLPLILENKNREVNEQME